MVIVFDMDNTLADEFGASVRPGMTALLERLLREKHTLVLWTNSKRDRAREILRTLDLQQYFSTFIFRENYDLHEKGVPKDIRKVKGDFLIDDDPDEIEYVQSVGKKGFLIKAYRKGSTPAAEELAEVYRSIKKAKRMWGKLFQSSQ